MEWAKFLRDCVSWQGARDRHHCASLFAAMSVTVENRLTSVLAIVKNERHTPVAMLAHHRVFITKPRLLAQGTDTVFINYRDGSSRLQLLLPLARGPPWSRFAILIRVPRTKKPRFDCQV